MVLRTLAIALTAVGLGAVPADAQSRLSVTTARQAIHRADAYAFVGRCHRTRYSVVCRVAHELATCTEAGACSSSEKIPLIDRVHWVRGRMVVSVLWEGTVSVPV